MHQSYIYFFFFNSTIQLLEIFQGAHSALYTVWIGYPGNQNTSMLCSYYVYVQMRGFIGLWKFPGEISSLGKLFHG